MSGPESAKVKRAGADFEAILLNATFSGLQDVFTHLPGASQSNTSKAYDGIAMQALTSGLSRSGGIGLGEFVSRWLAARNQRLSRT